MLRHEDNLVSRLSGNTLQPLAGISVTVTDNVTGLPASLYSDNGVTPITQAIVTDNDGYFGFYAPDGSYTMTFSGVRIAPFTRQLVLDDPADNPYVTLAGLSAGSGASLVTFTQAGTGAVPRDLQAKGRECVSVKDYGAKGDGVADDTTSIINAFNYAIANNKAVHFPAGDYLVTQNNFLGSAVFPAGYKSNLLLIGDGYASNITFKPSGNSDFYLYDNGATTPLDNSLMFPQFVNMQMTLSSANVTTGGTLNCFRLNSKVGAPAQGFKFANFRIHGPADDKGGITLNMVGTTNNSETYWDGGEVFGMKTLLKANNSQAVNHVFVGVDCTVMSGNVLDVLRGSAIHMFGGSVIMTPTADAYFLNSDATTDGIVGQFNFHGLRVEQRTAFAKIVKAEHYNDNGAKIAFRDCMFTTGTSGVRNAIEINAASTVEILFDHCNLEPANNKVRFYQNAAPAGWENLARQYATLIFRNGEAPSVDQVTWQSTPGGRLIVRDCFNTKDYDAAARNFCDYNGSRNRDLKTANGWILEWSAGAVNADGSQSTLMVPLNAVIKSIYVRRANRPAGTTATYQLEVIDGSGAVLGTSTQAAQNAEHNVFVKDLFRLAKTDALRTVTIRRASTAVGTGEHEAMGAEDFFLVEYC